MTVTVFRRCMAARAAVVAVVAGPAASASAAGGSIVAIRDNNVFLFSADGVWEYQLTSDDTPEGAEA